MRSKYLAVALLAAIISFGACKKKESSACDIVSFTVDGTEWQIGVNTVTRTYPKGTPVNNLYPVITVSEGAKVSPASGVSQDFSDDRAVTYTVTAENGKTKTYTAIATVSSGN